MSHFPTGKAKFHVGLLKITSSPLLGRLNFMYLKLLLPLGRLSLMY